MKKTWMFIVDEIEISSSFVGLLFLYIEVIVVVIAEVVMVVVVGTSDI